MGPIGGRDKRNLKADINVTPLVDVVLVLLIIFMVVTPMLSRGLDVDLPTATSSAPQHEGAEPGMVLSLTSDKKIYLDKHSIDVEDLAEEAKRRKKERRYFEVLIRADKALIVRDLRPVIHQLKKAGVAQISFAVGERKKGS